MLNVKLHRKALFNILRDICRSPIGAFLGFKGGTMLYFFHNLDRFSVDLDFDLLEGADEKNVQDGVREILRSFGNIKDEYLKENTIFFLLDYGTGEQNIKVEISRRIFTENHYEVRNFYGMSIRVLSLEDSFSHKLVAATERKSFANRDFYDIYFLLKNNVSFNEAIIRLRTGKSGLEYLAFLRGFIEKHLTQKTVLANMGELLDAKQKAWVKEHLKEELLAFLDFTLAEQGISKKVFDGG